MHFDLDEDQRLLEETLRRYFASDFPLTGVRDASTAGYDRRRPGVTSPTWAVLDDRTRGATAAAAANSSTSRWPPSASGSPRLPARSSSTCWLPSPSCSPDAGATRRRCCRRSAAGEARATIAVCGASGPLGSERHELAIGGLNCGARRPWVLGADRMPTSAWSCWPTGWPWSSAAASTVSWSRRSKGIDRPGGSP